MNYFAILRSGTAIYRLWREKSQISGIIDHVAFFWRDREYVSNELVTEEVERLRARQAQDIQIETMGIVPDKPVEVIEERETEKADTQPKRPRPRQRL
jgi:hypothetical protein